MRDCPEDFFIICLYVPSLYISISSVRIIDIPKPIRSILLNISIDNKPYLLRYWRTNSPICCLIETSCRFPIVR